MTREYEEAYRELQDAARVLRTRKVILDSFGRTPADREAFIEASSGYAKMVQYYLDCGAKVRYLARYCHI